MDIGLVMAPRNHPDHPYPLNEVYQDYIGDAVRAEELGFDNVWVGEHHMTACQWTPSPLTVLASIASHTKTVRIGSSVICVPFHNPLRLAEDVAAIDIISNGRFNFGFGTGSGFEEFRTFGVDPKERFGRTYEAAAFIKKCFTTDGEFDWEGKYYRFEKVDFTSKPTNPDLPFYASAMGRQSQELAGKRGYNLIAPGGQVWAKAVEEAGHDISQLKAQTLQPIVVADTTEAAWEASLDGLWYHLNFYTLRRNLDGSPADPSKEITRDMIKAGGYAVVGTPDEVWEQLQTVVEKLPSATTGLAFQFRSAGQSTDSVSRSMELFAEHIAPEFRKV